MSSTVKDSGPVVYFYREDDILDCASEAREFCDESVTLQGVDLSFDAVKSHSEFPEKYCSPFPLLWERTVEVVRVIAVYGSWARSGLPGGSKFNIEPQGAYCKDLPTCCRENA